MDLVKINIGQTGGDKKGDTLREALAKVNQNTDVLTGSLTGIPTAGDLADAIAQIPSIATPEATVAGAIETETASPKGVAEATQANVFPTRAELLTRNLPAVQTRVRTSGRVVPGIGGAEFVEITGTPSVAGWTSPDGRKWDLAKQDIHVEMFGARSYIEAELRALNGGASIDVVAAANCVAFQAADDYMFSIGGGTYYGKGQFYVLLERGWRYNRGVNFEGAGHGRWLPSFPSWPKTWDGTNLVAKGTGIKDYTAPGITSGEYTGGWRTDPDNPSRKFKITSFMNRDASGTTAATPRAMSVFIANKARHGDKGGLRRCRVVPWAGTDGISVYDTQSGNELGADWDIGVLIDTMEGVHAKEVQVRGYWRMIGFAEISPDFDTWSRSEANIIEDCSAQGFVGMAIRSGTQHRLLATTATTATIKWDQESIWPPSGQVNFPNAGYVTYSSLSRDGDNLVFNGLSGNPTGDIYLRNPYRGTGLSTGALINVEAWALWHHSGQSAEQLGFDRPSTGMEISGMPMRGLNFYNLSVFGENMTSPNIHMHNAFDCNFFGGKAEIGFAIASPIESSQELPTTAAGSTNNLGLEGFQLTASVDDRLFKPRSVRDLQRQWNPLSRGSSDFLLEALANQEIQLRMAPGKNFRIVHSDGSYATTVFPSGAIALNGSVTLGSTSTGLLSSTSGYGLALREGTTTRLTIPPTTGHLLPGADNTQNLGSASLRIKEVFAGAGAINTSDAREKALRDGQPIGDDHKVSPLTAAELAAASDIAAEIGVYKWRDAVAEKGDDARLHIGLTVQRAIAIMEGYGLDPWAYGFVCKDPITRKVKVMQTESVQATEDVEELYAEIENRDGVPVQVMKTRTAQRPKVTMAAVVDEAGVPVMQGDDTPLLHPIPVMLAVEREVEIDEPAGDRLGFRHDELMLFILGGIVDRA